MLLLLVALVPPLLSPALPPLPLRPPPPMNTMCEEPREVVPGLGDGDGDGLLPSPQSPFACALVGGGTAAFLQAPKVATTAAPVINKGTTRELLRRAAAVV